MDLNVQWAITFGLFSLPLVLSYNNRVPPVLIYVYICILLLISVILPVIFYSSLFLQRFVLYFYFFDRPNFNDLKTPEKFGFPESTNFYVQNGDISLGVWHLAPSSQDVNHSNHEKSLADGTPVILYIHGNLGSRATEHRIQLYKVLNKLKYHVITFDFRCFGDSTYASPNEKDVVSDCLAVAKWVIKKCGSSPLFLYGHSIGSGMTTNVAAQLAQEGYTVKGVILEAPFNNMPSEIMHHPFGTTFRWLPWYKFCFSSPYETNGEDFRSSLYIQRFPSPILQLHAEDDNIIPISLGKELYTGGRKTRPKEYGPMCLHLFGAHKELGHTHICNSPELPNILRTFIEHYKNKTFGKPHSS